MNCGHCNSQLLNIDSLCFYFQNERSVSLIVKHEQFVIQEKKFQEVGDSRIKCIACPACLNVVGKKIPVGPNNTTYMAFGNEKVIVFNTKLDKKKQPWISVYKCPPFNTIAVRTAATFFGSPTTNNTTTPLRTPVASNTQRIHFASRMPDFLYTELLHSNVLPRDYQIAAYVEALQQDLLIVIPTGSGKTLIATIVAARMRQLNPDLMILFLAERVPLVFQQGDSISFDTHLDVCCLSSENNTGKKRRELLEGEYDILVSTAGAYVNLEQELGIEKFSCVIFDECHHATKAHNYVKVLDKIRERRPGYRPRVIGLTASPPSVKGDCRATRELLDEMRRTFFDASIYYNRNLEISAYVDTSIENRIVPVTRDRYFSEYTRILREELKKMATLVNQLRCYNSIRIEDWGNAKGILQLINMLSHLGSNRQGQINDTIKSMRLICTALDVTEMLGVTYANIILKDLDIYKKLGNSQYKSPRLESLLSLLQELPNSSRIIVFVQTRQIAQILSTILKDNEMVNTKFSPLKIVGQYGALGMGWETEQKEILEKFRRGNCNLLVSTSVLEEGLDVPECNVVIRFDGITSLTSFKQSKGRARKHEGSRFIMILSDEEHAMFNDILASEAIVRIVLEAQYSLNPIPTSITLDILQYIHQLCTTNPNSNSDTILDSTECVIEFYITDTQGITDLQEFICEFLFDKYFLTVKQFEKAKNDAEWKSKGIFPSSNTMLTLGIQSQHNIFLIYKKLILDWDFTLNSTRTRVWSRILVPPTKEPLSIPSWHVKSIQWGKFINAFSFQLAKKYLPQYGVLNFQFDESSSFKGESEKYIFIQISHKYTIKIYLYTIHRFILAHWADKHVTLYLPLNSSPVVLSGGEGLERFTSTNCEYLAWFGLWPVVGITLLYSRASWSQLMAFLHSSNHFHVLVFDSRISVLHTSTIEQIPSHFNCQSKEVQDCTWALSVLKCNRDVCVPDDAITCFYQRIGNSFVHSTIALWRTIVTISNSKTPYFIDLIVEFQKQLKYVKDNNLSPPSIPPNFTELECAILTPSRVICLQPILTQSNRLFRQYPQERFLNLAFREEQGQPLQAKAIIEFVKSIIQYEVKVEGNLFYFLLCSGSQLRSKHAIFIQIQDPSSAKEIIKTIRFELLGNSQIYIESKYLSRLGLFCTSDHPSFDINEYNTRSLPDLLAVNGLMLTDGAGKIAKFLADQVIAKLNEENQTFNSIDKPSAFQIRLAGLKGVLTVVDENTDADFQGVDPHCCIIYRDSMKKINWTHSTLCIVKYAKYNECFLNMQVINLITSLQDPDKIWNPNLRIKFIFDEYLRYIALMFTDYKIAQRELTNNLPNYLEQTIEYFDILTEPYYISLLRCIYAYKIKNLIEKFRIPVKDGCLLMGIPDPIGVLRDGEVYVRFQTKSQIFTLTGRLLVYKNPCLHPGDLLTPTAVDVPALYHLINVIVFPICGKTSLPASSGGSDLDGDEFSIIWDHGLIPPERATVEPLNYDSVLKNVIQLQNRIDDEYFHLDQTDLELLRDTTDCYDDPFAPGYDVEDQEFEPYNRISAECPRPGNSSTLIQNDPTIQQRLAEAYYRIISNDSLGIICHYHISICDQKPNGACDPLSIELAKAASIAVDSPKTGVLPRIPKEAVKLIREKGYPDFMDKLQSPSYPSSKLMGELYRMAKSICYQTPQWTNITKFHKKHNLTTRIPGNRSTRYLMVADYHKYMRDARFRYHEYCNALQRIMLSFGVETEAEAIMGLIINCHPLLSADKGKITTSLRAAVEYLLDEFREIFYRNTPLCDHHAKASAWCMAAYQQKGEVFLSFPWVIGRLLCEIVPKRRIGNISIMYSNIGQSAKEYICKNSDYLQSIVKSKLCVIPRIESCINDYMRTLHPSIRVTKFFQITAFGSVSVYLCGMQSDLDLSISLTSDCYRVISRTDGFINLSCNEQRAHILNTFILPCVSEIANKLDGKLTAEIPIISLTMDPPEEGCTEIEIDLAIQSDGVQKSEYIQKLYVETHGIFFGWLWIIVHWARHVGILKFHNTQDNTGIILTAEFEALALYIYDRMSNKPKYPRHEFDPSLDNILNSIMSIDIDSMLGKMLEEFFYLGAEITKDSNDIIYTWPVDGQPTHTILKGALKQINILLFQAWHCLIFTRNISKLFDTNLCNSETLRKRFSPYVSDQIRQSTEFYRALLEKRTGSSISFQQVGRNLLLIAIGSAKSIHDLNVELNFIEKNTLTTSFRTQACYYMLQGCMALVMRNQTHSTRVELKPYYSMYKLHHNYNERSNVVIADKHGTASNWEQDCINRLKSLMWNQLTRFPGEDTDQLATLQLKTRFGYFYILDGAKAFQSVGGSLYLEEFEKCLLNDKKFPKHLLSNYGGDSNPNRLKSNASKTPPAPPKLKKQRLKSISSAFCPGIYSGGRGDMCDVENAQLVYQKALEYCGFKLTHSNSPRVWRVDVKGTASRDLHIDFNEKFEVVRIAERPFIWMLATIVGDRANEPKPEKVHDIRLRVESYEKLNMNSELFTHFFPNGVTSQILSLGNDGLPIINNNLYKRVRLIIHNTSIQLYTLDNTIAKICTGIEYSGDNIQRCRRFCELSLSHTETELREAVESGCDINEVHSIATKAIRTSLNVSNALSIVIQKYVTY